MTKIEPNQVILITIATIIACTSCVNTKKAVYFNNIQDSELVVSTPEFEPIIKSNDILSITVSSLNPEASSIFNKPDQTAGSMVMNTPTTTHASGYLVNAEGFIQFPILGNLKVSGLTQKQLKSQLTKALVDKKLLIDPVVDIRYLNFRVSIMGEVARPTVVTVPSEKISILEALSLAGDLTIYARRDNVLLIRDEGGKRITRRIDLTSNAILTSPYYNLKSNDIIYVEPNKSKVASTSRITLWVPVVLSFLTFGIIVVDHYDR